MPCCTCESCECSQNHPRKKLKAKETFYDSAELETPAVSKTTMKSRQSTAVPNSSKNLHSRKFKTKEGARFSITQREGKKRQAGVPQRASLAIVGSFLSGKGCALKTSAFWGEAHRCPSIVTARTLCVLGLTKCPKKCCQPVRGGILGLLEHWREVQIENLRQVCTCFVKMKKYEEYS